MWGICCPPHKYNMDIQRTSCKFSKTDEVFPVILDLTKQKKDSIELIYTFIEMWLMKHAHHGWTLELLLEASNNTHFLKIIFENPQDAIYFKLGPNFWNTHTISKLLTL